MKRFILASTLSFALTGLVACGSSSPKPTPAGGGGGGGTTTTTNNKATDGNKTDGTGRTKLNDSDFTVKKVEVKKAPVYLEGIDPKAQDDFRDGVLIVSEKEPDYKKAEEKFKSATEKDPAFLEAYFNWGMVLERTGRRDQALGIYQKALDKNPDDASAQAFIAKIYLSKARVEKNLGNTAEYKKWAGQSKALLDKLVAKDPNNVAVNNAIALYYLLNEDVDTSERYVKEVLYVQPSNTTALNTRGLINLKRGKYLIAQWIFLNKVINADPSSTEAHTNLGHTYIKLNQRPLAMRHFKQALKFDPTNADVRMNIAALLLEHLDYAKAFEHYEKVLEAMPNNMEAKIGRCDATYGLGGADPANAKPQFTKAIECYKAYLKEDPTRKDLYKRIAEAYQNKLQDFPNAISMFDAYGKTGLKPDEKKKNDATLKVLREIEAKGGLKAMMAEMPEDEEGEDDDGEDGDGDGTDGDDDGGEG